MADEREFAITATPIVAGFGGAVVGFIFWDEASKVKKLTQYFGSGITAVISGPFVCDYFEVTTNTTRGAAVIFMMGMFGAVVIRVMFSLARALEADVESRKTSILTWALDRVNRLWGGGRDDGK